MNTAIGASAGALMHVAMATSSAAAPIQSVLGGPVTNSMAHMSRPSEAWVFFAAAAMIALYVWACVRMNRWPRRTRLVSFFAAIVIYVATVEGPLDVLAWDRMFVIYIVEQILIYMLAAPLLLFGIPDWMAQPLLSGPKTRRVAKFLSNPIVTFGAFTVVFAGIHYPTICNAICHARPSFGGIRAALLIVGVLLWMPFLCPIKELRLSHAQQLLYLFLLIVPMTAVSAPITYSHSVVYTWLNGPPVYGLSPLLDQRMGGIVMWVGQMVILMVAMSIVFLRWSQEEPEDDSAVSGPAPSLNRRSAES